jgi:hypothetical protein
MFGKALAPQRHRLPAHAQSCRDPQIGRPRFGAGEDDAQALSEGLARPAPAEKPVQLSHLVLAEIQNHSLWPAGPGAPPRMVRSSLLPRSANANKFLTQTTSAPDLVVSSARPVLVKRLSRHRRATAP